MEVERGLPQSSAAHLGRVEQRSGMQKLAEHRHLQQHPCIVPPHAEMVSWFDTCACVNWGGGIFAVLFQLALSCLALTAVAAQIPRMDLLLSKCSGLQQGCVAGAAVRRDISTDSSQQWRAGARAHLMQ